MSFIVPTKYRTEKVELMDDFTIGGTMLENTLGQLATINRWLGGNTVTINGVKKLLKNVPKKQQYTIVDLGCGNGDMLRKIAKYGKKQGYHFQLIGIDANGNTINFAQKLSQKYSEISYLHQDIFSEEFKKLNYDMVLSTLFLHHFSEDKIVTVLNSILKTARIGVVVNDLHRHPLAYYLFKALGLFIQNPMVKEDGLISILRGFKRADLERISKKLKIVSHIQWKWAFRYQWILINTNTQIAKTNE